jgi:hypothetical protein
LVLHSLLPFTDLTGLGTAALLPAALLLAVPGASRLPRLGLALLVGGVFLLALLPLGHLPAAGYVRGVIGDLSVTAQILLVRALARPFLGLRPLAARNRHALQALLAGLSLVLYPFALGLGSIDPYRLGYGSLWLLTALLLLALAFWGSACPLPSLCLALSVLAYAFGWLESNNLWDYLLDPLVSVYAWGGLLLWALQALLARARKPKISGPGPDLATG